ncbi:MAG TPA: hypothetical protein VMN35_08305 [Gaiellaceae bacterium]|nr:hypothetical protein [Gaiellaceae bacterium]
MRLVPLLAVAWLVGVAALAGTARAQPAFTYDRELGALARATLQRALPDGARGTRAAIRRVSVRCYESRESFERSFERRLGVSARRVIAYYAGGADVHLRSLTCENVRSFVFGRHTVFTSAALSILLHESLHRQGLRNERLTTCFANEAVRWGAEWLGATRERALRARNLAFEYTRRYSPPSYFMGRPTCLALARRTTWRDHAPARR